MNFVSESIAVPLPKSQVEAEITRYFESRRTASGAIVVPLRVSIIERDVAVSVVRRRDAENLNEEFGISWTPADGGPYPSFSGRMIVWSEANPDVSFIELSGSYEPPMGAAGELFDAAAGDAIARHTLRTFLNALKKEVRIHASTR